MSQTNRQVAMSKQWSILFLAFDLFNIINTFVQCQKKVSEAEKSYAKVEEAEAKVQETENNVQEFENTLSNGVGTRI